MGYIFEANLLQDLYGQFLADLSEGIMKDVGYWFLFLKKKTYKIEIEISKRFVQIRDYVIFTESEYNVQASFLSNEPKCSNLTKCIFLFFSLSLSRG